MQENDESSRNTSEFSPLTRRRNIERMQAETFDLVIVGGGITGAGIARDAALRGLKVALLEKEDYASGTSSKSARMVHGGLRYLEHYQLALVFGACVERRKLFRIAPRLVRPIPFVFPVYQHDRNGYLKIDLGMWLYDLLALFRNVHLHKMLGADRARQLVPQLRREGLVGAAYYYDCVADDARLTLATIQAAHQLGAVMANYVQVVGLLKEDGKVRGVQAQDRLSSQDLAVKARVVVNATGVWGDTLRLMDAPYAERKIRANRGTHIVVSLSKVGIENAVAFIGADGHRAMYAIPWSSTCIIGTTDVDHQADLDNVSASPEEVQFIVDSVNKAFPRVNLSYADIISTYAGLRPLIGGRDEDAYNVSRDFEIFESESGLVSVAGGKLTIYRAMACDVVDSVVRRLASQYGIKPAHGCKTDRVPLAGVIFVPEEELTRLTTQLSLTQETIQYLVSTYGPACFEVLKFAQTSREMQENIIAGLPYIWAEVPYTIQGEMAMTLNDFMTRRTHIIHEAVDQGRQCAPKVASTMAQYLGWDEEESRKQVEAYQQTLALSKSFMKQ